MSVEELHAYLRAPVPLDASFDASPPLEQLCCHLDLVDRITELGRFVRARRVFVGGCPVLLHRSDGTPFACASGTHTLLVRSGAHPGGLALDPAPWAGLDGSWWRVDAYPNDVTFRRGTERLRDLFALVNGAP